MAAKNERKLEVLKFVDQEGEVTPDQVADIFDMEIEKGIEGLIHISEMSWTQHITNPSQMVTMGQLVEAQILNIDLENRKLSLGMKQLTPNPWQSLLEKFF